jgi:target of EGR1 protein 1
MVSLSDLPVLKLNKNNIENEWHNLINKIKDSTFISIDLELSGLGNRKNLNKPSIDDRYKYLIEIASKYSIISIGISCFKLDNYDNLKVSFKNDTFDLFTLCEDDFVADLETLKFHRKNNFNFNELFSNGIYYYKGKDRQNKLPKEDYLRRLIRELSLSNIPIVFHNGLIDLVFLYENFYDKCPIKFMKFISEIADLFPQGLYDTKYIADFHARTKASFLEYLFRR